jgi:hypothetical protein
LALQVLYGYQAHSNQDELLSLASETIDILANRVVSSIGIWPVDIIPARKPASQIHLRDIYAIYAVRHIPTWFPGAAFKRNALKWKAKLEDFVNKPYDFTKKNMVMPFSSCNSTNLIFTMDKETDSTPSFCSTILEDSGDVDDETELDIKWVANSMYAGGIRMPYRVDRLH